MNTTTPPSSDHLDPSHPLSEESEPALAVEKPGIKYRFDPEEYREAVLHGGAIVPLYPVDPEEDQADEG